MADAELAEVQEHIVDWIDKWVKGEITPVKMTKEQLQDTYALAYTLYRQYKYQDADIFFRLLITAVPSESKYWKGLGACLQMKGKYDEALNCYACAQMLNQDKPDPFLYVYAADCYCALKQIGEGLKALDAAYSIAKKTNHSPILQHVALMREGWLNNC